MKFEFYSHGVGLVFDHGTWSEVVCMLDFKEWESLYPEFT